MLFACPIVSDMDAVRASLPLIYSTVKCLVALNVALALLWIIAWAMVPSDNPHTEGQTMLVLSRREGEDLLIGDDIIVRLLELRGDHARLGIVAPRETPVVRSELVDRETLNRFWNTNPRPRK